MSRYTKQNPSRLLDWRWRCRAWFPW